MTNDSLEKLQTKIKEERAVFQQLDEQKEELFAKRSNIGKQIAQSINEVKKLRTERDTLTSEVKLAKEERAKITVIIKEKISKFQELTKDKKPGENPQKYQKEIERLEFKVETEALSFEKEKQMMKVINDLRKKFKAALTVSESWKEGRDLSREIEESKKTADVLHEKIQQKARESQEKHEKIITLSKTIDELKKQEDEILKQIGEKKDKIHEVLKPLDEKQAQMRELRKDHGKEVKERHEKREHQQNRKLSELQREVQEKLKRREKLTTQDLIVLQSIPEEDGK